MYWTWAIWVGEPFWGGILGYVVIIGETLCWTGILLCSGTIHFFEDSTWTTHSGIMLFYSTKKV